MKLASRSSPGRWWVFRRGSISAVMSVIIMALEKYKVLFDIITGLEKLVHIYFSSSQPLRRYLTLFYGFTLGLALVLAFLAVVQRVNAPPGAATVTQAVLSQTAAPIQASTQNHADSTSPPLPAISSTPNVKIPSALGLTADQLRGLQVGLWHPWTGSMGAVLQSLMDEFNRP